MRQHASPLPEPRTKRARKITIQFRRAKKKPQHSTTSSAITSVCAGTEKLLEEEVFLSFRSRFRFYWIKFITQSGAIPKPFVNYFFNLFACVSQNCQRELNERYSAANHSIALSTRTRDTPNGRRWWASRSMCCVSCLENYAVGTAVRSKNIHATRAHYNNDMSCVKWCLPFTRCTLISTCECIAQACRTSFVRSYSYTRTQCVCSVIALAHAKRMPWPPFCVLETVKITWNLC